MEAPRPRYSVVITVHNDREGMSACLAALLVEPECISGDAEVIVVDDRSDDGSGEAGDLVALKDVDEKTIKLCLVHCKNAHEGEVSQDIRNFYVLCGQAQKSVSIKHRGMNRLYHDLKRRHEAWMVGGHSRFLKGDIKQLAYFRDKSRRSTVEFEVIIVQPGASAAAINPDALLLLGTTELYLIKTAAAAFRVVLSP